MSNIVTKIESYIADNKLLSKQTKIIVGVSGGADSVALLLLLQQLEYTCVAAHCNFHLRGQESNRDQKFVENLCEQRHVYLKTISFDTKRYASEKKISIEMAARDLRYNWFESLRKEYQAEAICVAHHKNDSIETFLMNIIQGTGIAGLTGIKPKNGYIIRPFLCISRFDIEEFLQQKGVSFITDSTNKENEFTRNKIRNIIIPELEKINPNFSKTITENIENLTEVSAIYEDFIEKKKNEIAYAKDNCFFVDLPKLRQEKRYKTILYEILKPFGFKPQQLNVIANNLDSIAGKKYYSETHELLKDRDNLIITKAKEHFPDFFHISEKDSVLETPIFMHITKLKKENNFTIPKDTHIACLDGDKMTFPLILTKWKRGDSFFPLGMKNSKKVSDFFIDEKTNLIEKHNTWILKSDEKIAWIVGKRIDDRFKITEKTKNIILLEIMNLEK